MENFGKKTTVQRLMVATLGRIDMINVAQLVRIEAQSNYSKLIFEDGKVMVVAKVLKKFEAQLEECSFIRTHKTHLVNLHFVKSYEGVENKSVVLANGENIAVSRSKQHTVVKHLMAM